MQYFSDYISNMTAAQWFFLLFAAVAVGAALEVVMQRNPRYSASARVITFAALAANYILLKAQFIAAIQIIVYAGAIIVLFLFVIMLLNIRTEESRIDTYAPLRLVVWPSLAVLFGAAFYVTKTSKLDLLAESANSAKIGTVEQIGKGLFTTYLLPFEAASVLIMMAIVGALVLAQRTHKLDIEERAAAEPEPEPEPAQLEA